jgi:5-carboxymethyl-2-hydroxymuconate isomerase
VAHLTLEYSGNLRGVGNFAPLCGKLAKFMVGFRPESHTVFPPGGVRIRAIPCDDYAIADGSVENAAFVHGILKIGAGRSEAIKQAVSAGLFALLKEHFAAEFSQRGLALSLEMLEFSETGTLKHNNLHSRFESS